MSTKTSEHPIFTRILLGALIIPFCIWGIGDIFRNGGGAGSVAKVGKMTITMSEFQNALRKREENMREKLGKDYSPELMKKLGIERQALESIVNDMILEQEAASMGMEAGEDDVAEFIAHNPDFLDAGQFSKERYLAILQSENLSERTFMTRMQSQLAVTLLYNTVAGDMPITDDLVYAFYRTRFEKRAAGLLFIPANAGAAAAPSDKDIKAYYDAHNEKYMIPEYRSFSYVELKADDIRAGIKVSEDEVQKAYNDRIEEFKFPERRTIEQLVFEKKEDADKASATLGSGKTMAQVAAAMPVMNKDKLMLGDLTKQAVPVAADEAFALKEGERTKPAQSAFGWHILQVDKILPAGAKPVSEVRSQLVNDITNRLAEQVMSKQAIGFEDMMGGGASLEDAAKKFGLKLNTVTTVTRDGLTMDGSKPQLPNYGNFMEVAFATADKDHSRMVQAADNSAYFMVHTDGITAAHPKPLAEVLPQVTEAVKKEQAGNVMRKLAEQAAKDLKAGKKPEEALAGKAISPVFEASGALSRTSESVDEGKLKGKILPPELVTELFTLKLGGYTNAQLLADGSYVIGRLDQIIPAPDISAKGKDAPELKSIREGLQHAWAIAAQNNYLQYLRLKYPVTINNRVAVPASESDE